MEYYLINFEASYGRHYESTFLHVDLERALFRATVVAQLACEILDLVVHGVDMFLQPKWHM